MKTILKTAFFCLMLLLVSNHAHALRCGTNIVNIGDTKDEVMQRCGPPIWVDSYVESRGLVRQPVEAWTYDFGKTRFMQELLFEDGVLRRINQRQRGRGN